MYLNTVSIPLWYDQKNETLGIAYSLFEFQFHFGTIRSVNVLCGFDAFFSFNSTLVRLEASPTNKKVLCIVVSIPLWYDQKFEEFGYESFEESFNSTLVRLEVFVFNLTRRAQFVSIPLWYDQKEVLNLEQPFLNKFQFHFGTIRS